MTRILISNDDGIHAPGILALIEVAREFGELTIVAPDSPQSAMGHAISIARPLRLEKEELPFGLTGLACNGTPADCVKLATGVVMDNPPDLILSGVNHGSNSSVSSIYSGTLSAAREGAIQGIPAISFSLCHYSHSADLEATKEIIRAVLAHGVSKTIRAGELINVNIPPLPISEIKGIKVVKQAVGRWVEEFDERTDPFGRKYYWLTGKFILQDEREDVDEKVLADGYVSVTPMLHDLTSHESIQYYQDWGISLNGKA